MSKTPYDEEIRVFCKNVLERLGPRSIILYGSMATRRFGSGSDVDMIIISENFPENFVERLKLLFELNPTMAPIEPLGYKPNEFLNMIRRRHPTALYAASDGIPLYDDGFFNIAKKLFENIRKEFNIVEIEHGWEARNITSKTFYNVSKST